MAITYPVSMPSFPAVSSIRLTQQNLVAVSTSQFTGAQQVQAWPGEWWEAEFSLQPLSESQAGPWRGFLASLRGQAGTFLMGPGGLVKPRGTLGARPNLLRSTASFSSLASDPWGGGGLTVASLGVASPYAGAAQQITFAAGSSGNVLLVQHAANIYTAGQTFTASVYLYSASGTQTIRLGMESENNYLYSDVSVTAGSWQRVSVTATFPADASNARGLYFTLRNVAGQPSKTLGVWGTQLERGSAATTYQGASDGLYVVSGTPGQKSLELGGMASLTGTGGWLLAGDYLQIGSHLYMALTDGTAAVDGSGLDIDVFPALRSDVANGANAYYIDPVGIWRLQENPRGFSVATGNVFEFSGIKCREAI
jgi:hypothetical protein